jgi:cytoskeletal protein CcmA (bactofilin family)
MLKKMRHLFDHMFLSSDQPRVKTHESHPQTSPLCFKDTAPSPQQSVLSSPSISTFISSPTGPGFQYIGKLKPDFSIGEESCFIGKISCESVAYINGVFEGQLEGVRAVIIGPQGFVKSNLDLDEAEITGKVEGNIQAKGKVILKGFAEIKGDITAARISVEEGVSIIGKLCITPLENRDLNMPF